MPRRHRTESSASESNDLNAHIGGTVRRLRAAQGLTLQAVGQRANVSQAMLSRLETGSVMPSLDTLLALTDALGVAPADLFQGFRAPRQPAQLVKSGQGLEVVRRGTRRGHTYHLLAASRGPRRQFEPFLVTLTDKSEVFPGFEHPGTEFIYLLKGSLTYRHGEDCYALSAGDSLTFTGSVPHGPEKLLKLPIVMLSIIMHFEDAEA